MVNIQCKDMFRLLVGEICIGVDCYLSYNLLRVLVYLRMVYMTLYMVGRIYHQLW
jgi:hypothetical protein